MGLLGIIMTSSGSQMIFRVAVSSMLPRRVSHQVASSMGLVTIFCGCRFDRSVDIYGSSLQLELLLLQAFMLQTLPLIGD